MIKWIKEVLQEVYWGVCYDCKKPAVSCPTAYPFHFNIVCLECYKKREEKEKKEAIRNRWKWTHL